MSAGLRCERLHDNEIARWAGELAEPRVTVFREWPCLYEGDIDSGRRYLQYHVGTPRAFALIVFDGGRHHGRAAGR